MSGRINHICKSLYCESRERGMYYFLIMYLSNTMSILRGIKFKIIYLKNIKCSLFFIQSGSHLDIYNKKSKLIIKPFVFIRRNVTIRIDHNSELTIGEKVFINDNCSINCINKVVIGDYTKIGPGVSINDNDHNFRGIEQSRMLTGDVIIGKNVWIGANVVILRNTYIGDNAVIAAGSVIKGQVPANSVFINRKNNQIINYKRISDS